VDYASTKLLNRSPYAGYPILPKEKYNIGIGTIIHTMTTKASYFLKR